MLGETHTYSFEAVTTAIRLITAGARFVATNPDATGPSHDGILPATGAVAALMTRATGVDPYFVGKPNPLMMRAALNRLQAHSETTTMIGDRMDTDIVAGLEAACAPCSCSPASRRPRTSTGSPSDHTGSWRRSPTSSRSSDSAAVEQPLQKGVEADDGTSAAFEIICRDHGELMHSAMDRIAQRSPRARDSATRDRRR